MDRARGLAGKRISGEFLKRGLAIPLLRAEALIEQLVLDGIVGTRTRAGYPVLPNVATAERGLTSVLPAEASPTASPPSTTASAGPPRPRENAVPGEHPAREPLAADEHVREFDPRELTIDASVQPRLGLDERKVAEYAERMAEGDAFPPVLAFQSPDAVRVADGFHRLAAAKQAKLGRIRVRVRPGGLRDAALHAVLANVTHGLPLRSEEKRRAARRLLDDPEWSQWSDQAIARHCGLSGMTVGRLRGGPRADDLNNVKGGARKYRAADGRVRTMDVSRLGRRSTKARSDVGSAPPARGNQIVREAPDGADVADAGGTSGRRRRPGAVLAAVRLLISQADDLMGRGAELASVTESEPDLARRLISTVEDLLRCLEQAAKARASG